MSQGVIAGIAELDLVDGDGHAPAVGQGGGDDPSMLVNLIALAFQEGFLMLGQARRLIAEPLFVEVRSGQDRHFGAAPRRSKAHSPHRNAGLAGTQVDAGRPEVGW